MLTGQTKRVLLKEYTRMAKAHSNRTSKPKKPYAGFPLTWHKTGYWCKVIRGKRHYFGSRWGSAKEAEAEYEKVREDLHAGREPSKETDDGVRICDLANEFRGERLHRVETGELTQRTFDKYMATCERLVKELGRERLVTDLRPKDFLRLRQKWSEKWGLTTLADEVQKVRTIFKFAFDADLIEKPIKFGPSFKKPSQTLIHAKKLEKGPRLFEAEEIQDLMEIASTQLRAMILLGINCGYGKQRLRYTSAAGTGT